MVHRHTANIVSLTRIPASIMLLIAYNSNSILYPVIGTGISIFIVTTDLLDGAIARKYGLDSKLGYVLDGLADRAFHVTAYLILLSEGIIGNILAWLLIFREISQYAVRLSDENWHSTQSRLDRLITCSYTVAVQVVIFVSFWRHTSHLEKYLEYFGFAANLLLITLGIASYYRIALRLSSAWTKALDE